MLAVRHRAKYILRVLPAGHLIPALLLPFFHNVPVQLEFMIALRLRVSRYLQLRHSE